MKIISKIVFKYLSNLFLLFYNIKMFSAPVFKVQAVELWFVTIIKPACLSKCTSMYILHV